MPLQSRGAARTPTPDTGADGAPAPEPAAVTVAPRRGKTPPESSADASPPGTTPAPAPAPKRAPASRGRPLGSTSKPDGDFDPKATRARLKEIETSARDIRADRTTTLRQVAQKFDDQLSALQAEHSVLSRQLSSSLFR